METDNISDLDYNHLIYGSPPSSYTDNNYIHHNNTNNDPLLYFKQQMPPKLEQNMHEDNDPTISKFMHAAYSPNLSQISMGMSLNLRLNLGLDDTQNLHLPCSPSTNTPFSQFVSDQDEHFLFFGETDFPSNN